MSSGSLNLELSRKTSFLGLKLCVVIGICVGVFIILIVYILSLWVTFRRKSRRILDKYPLSQIPNVSKDVDKVRGQNHRDNPKSLFLSIRDKSSDKNSKKMSVHLGIFKSSDADNISQCSSMFHHERGCSSQSREEGSSGAIQKQSLLLYGLPMASPLIGLPEVSHLGWVHWFTLCDLQLATNRFSPENVLGEGGYGVVYKGILVNGIEVAVRKLLNNLGQAAKEFRVLKLRMVKVLFIDHAFVLS
ncbi:probable receptor-like protein kinase At2g42960 [Camellia sinensis]|uniref:probable receptor-like protein kinase At2g42960 n=1 Tax=Camellia sinensis TaxID=4442 RepID=UPI001035633B|nr:probable receptor-like protein kinase At2g42960 [Camellia sinensis]